jgi:hypothetical protein
MPFLLQPRQVLAGSHCRALDFPTGWADTFVHHTHVRGWRKRQHHHHCHRCCCLAQRRPLAGRADAYTSAWLIKASRQRTWLSQTVSTRTGRPTIIFWPVCNVCSLRAETFVSSTWPTRRASLVRSNGLHSHWQVTVCSRQTRVPEQPTRVVLIDGLTSLSGRSTRCAQVMQLANQECSSLLHVQVSESTIHAQSVCTLLLLVYDLVQSTSELRVSVHSGLVG